MVVQSSSAVIILNQITKPLKKIRHTVDSRTKRLIGTYVHFLSKLKMTNKTYVFNRVEFFIFFVHLFCVPCCTW